MRRTAQAKGSAVLLRRSAAAGKLGNRILAAPNLVTTVTQAFLGSAVLVACCCFLSFTVCLSGTRGRRSISQSRIVAKVKQSPVLPQLF